VPEMENESWGEAVPDEDNALEQDLRLFEHSRNPDIKNFAAWQKRWNEYFRPFDPLLSKAAKKLGVDKICECSIVDTSITTGSWS